MTTEFNDLVPYCAAHVGEYIGEELEALGVRSSQLADYCHIARPTMSDILHGRRNMTPAQIISVADALGWDPRYLARLQATCLLDEQLIKLGRHKYNVHQPAFA